MLINICCEQIVSSTTLDGTINTLKKQYVDHITTVIYVVHYHGRSDLYEQQPDLRELFLRSGWLRFCDKFCKKRSSSVFIRCLCIVLAIVLAVAVVLLFSLTGKKHTQIWSDSDHCNTGFRYSSRLFYLLL